MEGPIEQPNQTKIFEVDVREGWDSESMKEIFLDWLKKQSFYSSDLVYSGFDADDIGKTEHSETEEGYIFCGSEQDLVNDESTRNPFFYAFRYNNPAIAIYNKDGLEEHEASFQTTCYKVKDSSAVVAIVKIKSLPIS